MDTPGFNAPPPNADDTRLTEDAVATSDAIFVLMDAHKGNPSDSLLKQLDRLDQVASRGGRRPVFLLINKADVKSPSERDRMMKDCKAKHGDRFKEVVVVSAKKLLQPDPLREPLKALDTATRKARGAWMSQTTVDVSISAGANGDPANLSYRIEIDGNWFDVPSSDGLASRQELSEIVQRVSADRHSLFGERLQETADQLKAEWATTLSLLDDYLNHANTTERKPENLDTSQAALDEIDDFKTNIVKCVDEIFEDAGYVIGFSKHRVLEGTEDNPLWESLSVAIKHMNDKLGRRGYSTPTTQIDKIKERLIDDLREFLDNDALEYESLEDWKKTRKLNYERRILDEVIQPEIDRMQDMVHTEAGRGQSQRHERASELKQLECRIRTLKEGPPWT